MEERLQKILSRHGVASRRKAEELIAARRVRVNGNTAQLGDTADEQTDVIEVDGVRLKRAAPEHLYMMLNKPRGYVTTLSDEKGRRTVADLVADLPERVYPVGRLDLNSEGLLLLTNDGELANRLMHPKREIEKVYLLWVSHYAPGAERSLAEPSPSSVNACARPYSIRNGMYPKDRRNELGLYRSSHRLPCSTLF